MDDTRAAKADGSVGSDQEIVAIFSDEIDPSALGDLSDDSIKSMLNELVRETGR